MSDSAEHQRSFDAAYRTNPLAMAIRDGAVDELGLAYKSDLHRTVWWQTTRNIWRLLGPIEAGDVLLNVGVGFGFDEKALASEVPGVEQFGVDISTEMISGAIANASPASLAVAEAERLPLPDGCFDRILSREVIEHVRSVETFLAELVRVARPGAVIVITTPNLRSAALRHLTDRMGIEDQVFGTQVFRDDPSPVPELERAFRRAGLEIDERLYDSPAWFFLSDLERTPIGKVTPRLARWLQALEGDDGLAHVVCDQVKWRLRVPGAPVERQEAAWRCPSCGGAIEWSADRATCASCARSYSSIGGTAPVFLEPSGEPIAQAIHTTRRTRTLFRVAFVLHGLVYGPMVLLARLLRRRARPNRS